MRCSRLIASLLLVLAVVVIANPSHAYIHALVIGINDYQYEKKLEGAVADAEDIAATLKKIGAKSVTILRDGEASRARVEQAWRELLDRAVSGDTLIFTYAGHGGQEDWWPTPGRREQIETFVLPGFRSPKPTSGERIAGKEIKAWFKTARVKQVRIVFVADACHAGGLMRSAAPEAGPTYRSTPYAVPDVTLPLSAAEDPLPQDLPHVTFIAATQPDKKIPEIVIAGKKRGALSYAFARALEGEADRSGRGQISNLDLQSYITPLVRQLSEAQQTPEVVYRSGGENDTLVTGVVKPRLVDLQSDGPTIALRLDDASTDQVAALRANLVGTAPVSTGAADLIWSAKTQIVLSGVGDVVARDITPVKLQGVVDKWRTLPLLKQLVATKPLGMALAPGDAVHPAGQAIAFNSAPLPYAHVTAFNLAADGTIQFLFPKVQHRDPAGGKWPTGESYMLKLEARSPFGADHLVVISSASPLLALHSQLQRVPRLIDLPTMLRDALAGGDYAIGMQGLYTQAAGGNP